MKVLISLTDMHTYSLPNKQKWRTNWMLREWERMANRMDRSLDYQGRWRSKTVAFHVSEEEGKLIDDCVKLSGLTKQDYIIRKLSNREVIVQGNLRVYKALRNQMAEMYEELKRLERWGRSAKNFFIPYR